MSTLSVGISVKAAIARAHWSGLDLCSFVLDMGLIRQANALSVEISVGAADRWGLTNGPGAIVRPEACA